MDLKTRLESHPVSVLKKEISKTNVKGYSRMRKNEVVALMLKNKERFNHIPHAGKKEPVKRATVKKEEPKKVKKIIRKEEPKKVKKIIRKEEPKNDNDKVKEFVNKLSNNFFDKDIKIIKNLLSKSGLITSQDMLILMDNESKQDDIFTEKVRDFVKNKNQTIYEKGKGVSQGKFLVGNYQDNWTDKQGKEYDKLYSELQKRRDLAKQEEKKKKKKK